MSEHAQDKTIEGSSTVAPDSWLESCQAVAQREGIHWADMVALKATE